MSDQVQTSAAINVSGFEQIVVTKQDKDGNIVRVTNREMLKKVAKLFGIEPKLLGIEPEPIHKPNPLHVPLVTPEMIEDAPSMEPYLKIKAAELLSCDQDGKPMFVVKDAEWTKDAE